MKLLGGTGRIITKDKSSDNVPKLQIAEVVLVKGIIVNDQFQQYSRVLSTVFPNTCFCQLLNISPTNHVYTETFLSELYGLLIKALCSWK